jgi:hypothetical protein
VAGKLDLITFNFGLHNLGNTTHNLATYEEQLAAITARLLAAVGGDTEKLLYLSTTPMMPACCGGSALLPPTEGSPPPTCKSGATAIYPCDSVVGRLNAAAARVMAKAAVATLDLHKVVTDVCAPTPPHTYVNCSICRMTPCSYHYTPEGYAVISRPIVDAIRSKLRV